MAESRIAVYAALAANLAIGATKFVAFMVSGSTAMLTETIHSVVDTGNEILLIVGMQRAKVPADAHHPFGHGLESYFWSFIVALMIFLIGGAVSVYEGIEKLAHPRPISHVVLTFAVLAAAAVFEGISFVIALRQLANGPGGRFQGAGMGGRRRGLWGVLRRSKDPNVFAVVLEDGAALLGLAIAALGVFASSTLRLAWGDGAASIAIGLELMAVAFFLANETRSLLTGEAASPMVVEAIRRVVEADPRVSRCCEILSMHLGPEQILVALTLTFRDDLRAPGLGEAADALTEAIRKAEPRVDQVFLRPGGRRDAAATPAVAEPAGAA